MITARVRYLITTRWDGGRSQPPFDDFNLSDGVPDDPAAVAGNRLALAVRAGLEPGRIGWMHQVHGTKVHTLTAAPASPVAGADGLVTTEPGLGLAVLVADCVPVLAADPAAGVIGVAHAGRRGAASGVVVALIDQMCSAGADLARIQVLLGPAICGRCYEVPAAMQDEVAAVLPGSACETAHGTPGLDLRGGLGRQLTTLGIGSQVIDSRCTREDPALFSHRRQASTGRFAGMIWLDRTPAGSSDVASSAPAGPVFANLSARPDLPALPDTPTLPDKQVPATDPGVSQPHPPGPGR